MKSELRSTISADGTTIAYRESGDGPGVVLVHGAMQSARSFSQLAAALSTSFRVYVPDRRGRGRSGPYGVRHDLAVEAEDLGALLRATGARRVFGLSSGALIALYAARNLPDAIDELAVYEPPLDLDGARPAAWASRYEGERERGDFAAAMVTILKGTGDVELLTYVPRFVLTPLLRHLIRADAAKAGDDHVAMRDLVPTVHHDVMLQREAASLTPSFAAIDCKTLLLGGSRSHRALRTGLDGLARLLPNARRVQLVGVGHVAAADDAGRPAVVADALRAFFSAG
jgi:pimeloyl-ACP methyl ester carboxylesterase